MNKAHPADLRDALSMAHSMVKAGFLFVPIPVLNAEDAQALGAMANDRLDQLTKQAEDSP